MDVTLSQVFERLPLESLVPADVARCVVLNLLLIAAGYGAPMCGPLMEASIHVLRLALSGASKGAALVIDRLNLMHFLSWFSAFQEQILFTVSSFSAFHKQMLFKASQFQFKSK